MIIAGGKYAGQEYRLEAPIAEMPDGDKHGDDLAAWTDQGNIAALKAITEQNYGPADRPFYYGKIDDLGYILSHEDLYGHAKKDSVSP